MTSTTPTEPEALAALKPILSAIAESGKIEAVDWHNIRRAICDGEAAMRERAAQIADAELVDTFEDSPEVDGICNSVVREIAKSIRALSTPAARMVAGEGEADCERCQGNGEIVTNWDRYMHGHDGDKGDEAVAECPDCNGTGKVEAHPPAAEPVKRIEDGHADTEGEANAMFEHQNCPACGGSGHVDDVAAEPVGLREALQLAHDTLHECTAVLTASDCAKVSEVMAACRKALSLATPARTDDAGVGGDIETAAIAMAISVDLCWSLMPDEPDVVCWYGMPDGCKSYWRKLAAAALSPAPDRGEVVA